jgi:hypothetical protein
MSFPEKIKKRNRMSLPQANADQQENKSFQKKKSIGLVLLIYFLEVVLC